MLISSWSSWTRGGVKWLSPPHPRSVKRLISVILCAQKRYCTCPRINVERKLPIAAWNTRSLRMMEPVTSPFVVLHAVSSSSATGSNLLSLQFNAMDCETKVVTRSDNEEPNYEIESAPSSVHRTISHVITLIANRYEYNIRSCFHQILELRRGKPEINQMGLSST